MIGRSKFTVRTNGPARGHPLTPSVGGDEDVAASREGRGWMDGQEELFQVLFSYPQATARGTNTTCVARPRRVSSGFGGAGAVRLV